VPPYTDSSRTYPARLAYNRRFVDQVLRDAETRGEQLTRAEIIDRVDLVRREHYRKLGRASVASRRARRAERESALAFRYPGLF
jgi:hypothetical protein